MFLGGLSFVGGLCFGLECNVQDVCMAMIDGGSLDQLRDRLSTKSVVDGRREAASISLFLLSLVLLEVVVQLFSGK